MTTLLTASRALRALDLAQVASASRVLATGNSNFSSSSGKDPRGDNPISRLGQTSVFFQAGLKIRELPLVVKKVNDVLQISGMDTFDDLVLFSDRRRLNRSKGSTETPADGEQAEVFAGFNRCFSVHGVFRLLETMPAEEVTPAVAVHVLKKIIDLENNLPSLRLQPPTSPQENSGSAALYQLSAPTSSASPVPPTPVVLSKTASSRNETFRRIAFANMLLDIVHQSKDPWALLEGLKIVSRDALPVDQELYKLKMAEEILVLVSDGRFNLVQICEAIAIFSDLFSDRKKNQEYCDNLWSGIMDASDQLSASTISAVFMILPHLRSPRDIILKLVIDRTGEFWQEYTVRDVLEMLKALNDLREVPGGATEHSVKKVLRVLSQWLKVNIHSLSEGETLAVIYCLHRLEYFDDEVMRTMEKYLKLRGCHIQERDLVATICDYCLDFRVRSRQVLEGVGEYFVHHADSLTTPQLFSIVRIFGELDFHPPNGFKFWEQVEIQLERRFREFPPKEAIELLLSFVYIERYPLNFVRHIFNPHFLDRLHSQPEQADVARSRLQLSLFDAAMRLEARNYGGPFLPKSSECQSVPLPSPQVLRLSNDLVRPLGQVLGNESRVGTRVFLSSLPRHPLYVADLMVYPSVAASLLRFGLKTDNAQTVIVLLHPREHLARGGEGLVGPQAMRRRHMRSMGFKVMELECEQVARLQRSPDKLRELLAQKYREALKS